MIEKTTTQQCIEEFIRRYPNHKSEIIINGDASGDNRSTQSEYTNYAIIKNALLEYGYKDIKFRLRDYNPPILNRISAFNARVKNSKGEMLNAKYYGTKSKKIENFRLFSKKPFDYYGN
mgnify:CR=1 FL=1